MKEGGKKIRSIKNGGGGVGGVGVGGVAAPIDRQISTDQLFIFL